MTQTSRGPPWRHVHHPVLWVLTFPATPPLTDLPAVPVVAAALVVVAVAEVVLMVPPLVTPTAVVGVVVEAPVNPPGLPTPPSRARSRRNCSRSLSPY